MKDVITGGRAICEFLNAEVFAEPITQSKLFHMAEAGRIPCGRLGSQLVASKKKLLAHFERLVSGAEG